MTAAQCDLPPIRKGDAYNVVVRFFADAAHTTPFDASSEDFEAGLSKTHHDDLVTLFDIDTTDAATGVIVLGMLAEDTEDLTPRVWRWRLRAGSTDNTWLAGNAPVGHGFDLGDTDESGVLDCVVFENEIIDVTFSAGFLVLGGTGLAAEVAARQAADTALDARLDAAEATLPLKADLVAGKVPDTQIPSTITRDSELASAVAAAVDSLLDGAPGALDTLNELAAALGDDADFAATITTALAGKQPIGTSVLLREAGTTVGLASIDGPDLVVDVDSKWGIDVDGNVYFDTDGATSGEEAVLDRDSNGAVSFVAVADFTAAEPETETRTGAQEKAAAAQAEAVAEAVQRENHVGEQDASTITDFDGHVQTSRLDQMAAPTSDVSFNGHRALLLGDPVDAQDAATRAWVLSQIAVLTSGAPGALDTFLEAYNRFLSDESAATALAALVAAKVASVSAGSSKVAIGGTATAPTIDVNQANLTIAQSQVTGLVAALGALTPDSGLQGQRAGAVGYSVDRMSSTMSSAGIAALTSGVVTMVLVRIPRPTLVSALMYWPGTTAAVAPTHAWGALTDMAGLVLAVSTDKTSAAIAASSEQTYGFVTPVMVAPGTYYAALCVTAGTVPTVEGVGQTALMNKRDPVVVGSGSTLAGPPAVGDHITLPTSATVSAGPIEIVIT